MDTSLLDLLRSTNNEDSKEFSHVTLYGPTKNWTINDASYEKFWVKYCELAEYPEKNKKKLCLAEIPRKHMPVIADLTLKFHPLNNLQNGSEEMYDDDFLLAIVYCYQQIIKETMKVCDSEVELICCVMKAETTVEDNLIVCRIRLQFPYCKLVAQLQNRIIRPLVLKMFRATNVIARLSSQPVNDWDDIVDPLSVEKPIVMYGSSSSMNIPKYVLEYIFPKLSSEEIDKGITGELRVMNLEDTFFPNNHEHPNQGFVTMKMFILEDEDEEEGLNHDFWLPYFLSIYYLKEITLPKNVSPTQTLSIKTGAVASNKKNNKPLQMSYEDEDQNGAEYLTTVFLNMLTTKRANEEHFWLDVGRALFNAFEGDERGLEKWISFSKTGSEFSDDDCKSLYFTFADARLTIKTLAFYAREDSPEEYRKWHEGWYTPYLEKALSLTHTDIATAIYKVYWLDFACGNVAKSTLYYFKNQLWKRLDSGHTLKEFISGEFVSLIENFRIQIAIEMQNSNDKNYRDNAEVVIQKICKLISKLKNRAFKNSVFSECSEKFYIDKFEEYLDTNPDLMGCINCIIECLDKKAIVRSGKCEDYISKTTGVYWRHDYSEKHPAVLKVLSYLGKVFPDKELMEYFGKLIAATLKGRNSDKIFPVHTGKGNNSKSMIKKLIEAAYGDYVITIPTGIFTGGKSDGSPSPAICRGRVAHIAFAQEPNPEEPFRSGALKELTGGDRIYGRLLHENGGEFFPMFTLNLMCNVVPIVNDSGDAMRNRLRLIPYFSSWVKNPPKNPDDQYKERKFLLDPFFEKQIPEMAAAFLWWLVKVMYTKYRLEGTMEPPIVRKATEGYWEENDIYGQFIKENIERAYKIVPSDFKGERPIDEKSFITLSDMYARYKDWFKTNYQFKVPDRQLFKNEMENRVTKCVQRNFYGIKFKVEVANI